VVEVHGLWGGGRTIAGDGRDLVLGQENPMIRLHHGACCWGGRGGITRQVGSWLQVQVGRGCGYGVLPPEPRFYGTRGPGSQPHIHQMDGWSCLQDHICQEAPELTRVHRSIVFLVPSV
jgi:hypothetical protein